MLVYLLVGTAGSIVILMLGALVEVKLPNVSHVISLVGQQTLIILCLHMFVYMFIQTGAAVLGLSGGLEKLLMVLGSMGVLTVLGCGWAVLKSKRK